MMLLYSSVLALGLLASAPVWLVRMLRHGRYREGLRQRLGDVPGRLVDHVHGRPVLWVHAVSVGETLAATRLVAELEAALPGYAIVISTTTSTGQEVARERFGTDRVFYYPLDFAFAVRAYLRTLRPALLVLMEGELWPRMLHECRRDEVPVAVVNARMSDRSLRRTMRLRALWKPVLKRVSLLLAQSGEDARRWVLAGMPAERVRTAGNLKFDAKSAEETPLTALLRKHLPPKAKVLLCGSTHAGEEAMLLDCWLSLQEKSSVLILAPRHPQRAEEVLALAAERGLAAVRLSAWRTAPGSVAPGSVLLLDTVGELASLYALAKVAFVGGSLLPHGGQNPLEPAQFGVPVVMGPSFENFRDVVSGLIQAGALTVVTSGQLCHAITSGMEAPPDPVASSHAIAFYQSQSGATRRAVAALRALLKDGKR